VSCGLLYEHAAVMGDITLSADEWIKLNYDHSGYYRVNYSPQLWQTIVNQLLTDHKVRTHLLQSWTPARFVPGVGSK